MPETISLPLEKQPDGQQGTLTEFLPLRTIPDMKYFVPVSLSLFCSLQLCLYADSLDEALAAQKKRAQRRVYSERAALTNLNIVLPTTPTEEQLQLMAEIEKNDELLSRHTRLRPPTEEELQAQQTMIRRREKDDSDNWLTPALMALVNPNATNETETSTERGEDSENWLTPAMLEAMGQDQEAQEEDDWVQKELERQKEQRELEKMVKEETKRQQATRQQNVSPYSDSLRRISGGNTQIQKTPSTIPSYRSSFSKSAISKPAASQATISKQPPVTQRPVSKPSWTPPLGTPKKQVSPLQKIKRQSPIYRDDPFSEDLFKGTRRGSY
jgi:hypothetical protein